MGYRAYKSVKLSDSWPNTFCQGCKEPIMLDPWREIKIGWSEVLQIAIALWGIPTGFFNRDFLIVVEFGEVRLVFCGQGPRRGEVEVAVPVGDEGADEKLQVFLESIRRVVEEDGEGMVNCCPKCGTELPGPGWWCYECGWVAGEG